jgi:hypothetical protein
MPLVELATRLTCEGPEHSSLTGGANSPIYFYLKHDRGCVIDRVTR